MRKYTEADFQDMVDFFDQMAQTPWLRNIHKQLVDLVINQKRTPGQDLRVLDVGCGTGRLVQLIAPHASFAIGMDFSKEMINRAHELISRQSTLGHVGFIQGDVEAIPFSKNSFDLCLATCLIFLLPEPQHSLAEVCRILNQNGTLAMLNPSPALTESSASAYIKQNNLSREEAMFLLKWTNVAQRKKRILPEEWEQQLWTAGFKDVVHQAVLDGLGLITIGHK